MGKKAKAAEVSNWVNGSRQGAFRISDGIGSFPEGDNCRSVSLVLDSLIS